MHGIQNVRKYNDARYNNSLIWVSNDTAIDQQTLFRNVTYNFKDVVKRLYVRYIKAGQRAKTFIDMDLDGEIPSVKEQRHRYFGRSHTFHPTKEIRDHGVYYVKLNL